MRMLARMPLWKDSTSMSALSDSTTRMFSPFSTRSPGFFSQATILPVSMVELRAGMESSWIMAGMATQQRRL
jgi:hypothetical protein